MRGSSPSSGLDVWSVHCSASLLTSLLPGFQRETFLLNVIPCLQMYVIQIGLVDPQEIPAGSVGSFTNLASMIRCSESFTNVAESHGLKMAKLEF